MSQHLPPPSFEKKIVPFEELEEFVSKLPHPIVLTNGVFDILHRGHVTYLAQAASLGASLVVAVNSDESVRMLGKDRTVRLIPKTTEPLSLPHWKVLPVL